MDKLLNFLSKHNKKILAGMVGAYAIAISLVCLWKYHQLLYNGLDLAIYNNALWNTAHGNWFWSTIQGHNYFGDHFEPILILLLPLYSLWQSPILLLILQTIFLGLAAWPIYLISAEVLNGRWEFISNQNKTPFNRGTAAELKTEPLRKNNVLALSIACLWLINPLVHNVNLFEFHAIAFLPFLFFWLFYFYLKLKEQPATKKVFSCFCVFVFLCLMVREDVAFIILAFLIIAWIDAFSNKNKNLLRITSYGLLITITYCLASFKIISQLSPAGFSPFSYYYDWLGQDWGEILKHILTIANLEMALGLLAPFLFLQLIRPQYLWLAVIPLGQIILSAAGGGALAWQIHYGALFLPALVLAFIFGFKKTQIWVAKKIQSQYLLLAVIIIFNLALWPSFGPFSGKAAPISNKQVVNGLIKKIEPAASMLASYEFLPNLSGRQEIYALNYFFLGKQQFGAADYVLSKKPEYILINFDDLIGFDLHLANLNWSAKYYPAGAARLRELLKDYGIVALETNAALLKKNSPSDRSLYSINNQQPAISNQNEFNFDNKIKLTNYGLQIIPLRGISRRETDHKLFLSLTLYPLQPMGKDYQIILNDGTNKKILPLAYGLYPTSQWQVGGKITISYQLDWPVMENKSIGLELGELYGGLEIGKLRSTVTVIDGAEKLGEAVKLKLE